MSMSSTEHCSVLLLAPMSSSISSRTLSRGDVFLCHTECMLGGFPAMLLWSSRSLIAVI